MLDNLFLQILNMSFTASYVIFFVLIARLLLKKAPKIFSYALWSVVLFRLVCPFSFESSFSWFSLTGRTAQQIRPFPETFHNLSDVLPSHGIGGQPVVEAVKPLFSGIFTLVWLVGIAALLIYSVVSLLKLRRKLKNSVHESRNIYTSASLTSPFVMGLFKPKIYLPAHLIEEEKCYIILHEQTHIKRFDYIIKIFSFFVLCLHWFNPLVWVAFFLSGRDMELSCDEAVIKKLGNQVKKDYSTSLLTLATGRRIVGGTPLAFGDGDTKSRIKNVLNYKKPAFWVVAVCVIAVVAVGVGLASNPKEKPAELGFAQTLWNARTVYVGNNVAVGNLLSLIPLPQELQHNHFALLTNGDQRGIEWFLDEMENATYSANELDRPALLLFALIDNLEDFYVTTKDPMKGGTELHYNRTWADKIVGGDIRSYGKTAEKLLELTTFTAAWEG